MNRKIERRQQNKDESIHRYFPVYPKIIRKIIQAMENEHVGPPPEVVK